jgi:small membrane protein
MIAQFILSILLASILVYAWGEYARSPAVAMLALFVATAGLYFVWVPEHSTQLAELVGIGRGVDLILYIWVCLSLIVVLNLHLKLRTQMELITVLARKLALADAQAAGATRQAKIQDSVHVREGDPDASVATTP